MLTRRYPEREIAPLRTALDWVLQDPWVAANRWLETGLTQPMVDVRETDDAFIVEVEMPGVKPEDTEVTLDGRTLSIRGRFQEEREAEGKSGRYLMHERRSGTFARTIVLPGEIDADKVTSKFENGELAITLPKAAQSRARRIPIAGVSGEARRVGSGAGGQPEMGAQGAQGAQTGQPAMSEQGAQGSQPGMSAQGGQGSQSG
jgi:HSP20 family protein